LGLLAETQIEEQYGSDDHFGCSVSNVGDVSDDGIDDFIVGAQGMTDAKPGMAYIVFGGNAANIEKRSSFPRTKGYRILGNASKDRFRCSVSGAGDVNGDEINNLIILACNKDSDKGASSIIYGVKSNTGTDINLAQALPQSKGFMVKGIAIGDQLRVGELIGNAVRGVGDLNGDGFADIMR